MRIGILTYHFSENFGALMQAYGLRQWLLEQGHKAEFINYHPFYVEEGGDFEGLLDPKRFRSNLKIAYLKISSLRQKWWGHREQAALFEAFSTSVLGVAQGRLETQQAVEDFLASTTGHYDMLICGSDQIWNPSDQKGLDPVYFLAMRNAERSARVAYAPSFGRGTFDKQFDAEARGYLEQLDGISVREKSGVTIVQRICGREAIAVPDPTILLGDFSALIASAEPVLHNTVFCYALRTGDGIRDVAAMVSAAIGSPVVSPHNTHRRWKEIGETIHPSPAGWAATIAKARFVVTNSFHGTVLSILLGKPFIVVGLPGAKASLNERVRNLLGELDLADRFVPGDAPAEAQALIAKDIDWNAVGGRLSKLQSDGRGYLLDQLAKAQR